MCVSVRFRPVHPPLTLSLILSAQARHPHPCQPTRKVPPQTTVTSQVCLSLQKDGFPYAPTRSRGEVGRGRGRCTATGRRSSACAVPTAPRRRFRYALLIDDALLVAMARIARARRRGRGRRPLRPRRRARRQAKPGRARPARRISRTRRRPRRAGSPYPNPIPLTRSGIRGRSTTRFMGAGRRRDCH